MIFVFDLKVPTNPFLAMKAPSGSFRTKFVELEEEFHNANSNSNNNKTPQLQKNSRRKWLRKIAKTWDEAYAELPEGALQNIPSTTSLPPLPIKQVAVHVLESTPLTELHMLMVTFRLNKLFVTTNGKLVGTVYADAIKNIDALTPTYLC